MVPSRQEARERRIISNAKPFIETPRATNPVRQSRASNRKRKRPHPTVSEPSQNPRRDRLAATRLVKRLNVHGSDSEPCREFQLSAQVIHDSMQRKRGRSELSTPKGHRNSGSAPFSPPTHAAQPLISTQFSSRPVAATSPINPAPPRQRPTQAQFTSRKNARRIRPVTIYSCSNTQRLVRDAKSTKPPSPLSRPATNHPTPITHHPPVCILTLIDQTNRVQGGDLILSGSCRSGIASVPAPSKFAPRRSVGAKPPPR